jgi:hypothetical protein
MLRSLIHNEIDPRPAVRRRVVSALLPGGNVLVPKGKLVGGDFAHLPLCTSPHEFRCVVAYSIFGADPPAGALFGIAPTSSDYDVAGPGLPSGPKYEVACTNPADLARNRARTFSSALRSKPFPGVLGLGLKILYGGDPPTAATPWLVPSDRYRGRCVRANGAHVLKVAPVGSSRTLHPSPDATWGLHLGDVNLPLGNLVGLVRAQTRAYLKAHPDA